MQKVMQNKIFTFWEPKDTIPPYLELCLETWKKHLTDYEIVVLNYSNLFEWLEPDIFDKILYTDFSLAMQADAIRCAILRKYGGIWFDIDTIVTSNKINEILNINSEFTLIGTHLAFIKASKNCLILNKWFEQIRIKIANYKSFKNDYERMPFLKRILNKKKLKKYKGWDYLGNSILNKLLEENTHHKTLTDRYSSKAFPEANLVNINNKKIKPRTVYRDFYFKNNYSKLVLDDNCGIICLHNSWTPKKIRKMSKKEFLLLDSTLSKLIKEIL